VRRRARGHRDGHARFDERDRGGGDGVLLALLECRLGRETRLEQGGPRQRGRTAVDLLEQAAIVEDLGGRGEPSSDTPSVRTSSAADRPVLATRSRMNASLPRASTRLAPIAWRLDHGRSLPPSCCCVDCRTNTRKSTRFNRYTRNLVYSLDISADRADNLVGPVGFCRAHLTEELSHG
jgi:hypothetical protein